MKKLLPVLIGLSLGSFSLLSHAEDLLQVYQQARESNPDLRKSAADRDAAYEKINQSRGTLLPQIGLSAGYKINRGYRGADDGVGSNGASGSVNLSQSLLDMSKWRALTITEKSAGIQDVVYQTQEQTLILDSATAYFKVLRAIDALEQVKAQKSALGQQLEQTRQRFNVGLVAITDVHNAQAEYDRTLASVVSAQNDLDNSLEDLRQITGVLYPQLSSLDTAKFKTTPASEVKGLLATAEDSNLSLISARLSQDLAREQIRVAQSGHLPTLDLSAGSSIGHTEQRGSNNPYRGSSSNGGSNSVGVSLSLPLFSGGQTSSQVKQAQYNFVGSSEQLEVTYRSVVRSVRSSYNNISAAISSIRAFQQTVVSAESSLEATQAGYSVGTRTIVDVLNATTSLYSARTQLSNARYDYLINELSLKAATGTLSEQDLVALNNDLGKAISTMHE